MKKIFQKNSFIGGKFLIIALSLFLLHFLIWPLVWHLIILPKSQVSLHGFRVDPAIQGSSSESFEQHFFPGNFFNLDQPNSSLSAYAVWNIPREGAYKIRITCDDNGQVVIDNRQIVFLSGIHPSIQGEGEISLSQGRHFLMFQLNNVLGKGWMKVELVKPGPTSYQPIDINELNYIRLGNIETWLGVVHWVKNICRLGLIIYFFFMFIWPIFRKKKINLYTGLICILLGLSSSLAFHTASLAPIHSDSSGAFHALSDGIENYRNFKVAWRSRLFTNFFAAKFVFLGEKLSQWRYDQEETLQYTALQDTVALWSVFWFLLIGLLYIFVAKHRSLFYLFGTVAAILFDYIEDVKYIYPWDMPILFIFTLFVILYAKRKYWRILLLLPLGMGFKETTIVLCLAFLFCELSGRRRALMFTLSLTLCLIVKIAIDIYVKTPLPFFTMEHGYDKGDIERLYFGSLYFIQNLNLLTYHNFLPLLVNGGTLLAFLILPSLNQTIRTFKMIGLAFIILILLFGRIDEYRIFFEMIPFALYSLAIFFYGKSFVDNQE